MTYDVQKYPHGTFCWAEAMSSMPAECKQFMQAVMGWQAEDLPTSGGDVYTLFRNEGKAVAGSFKLPEAINDLTPAWYSFVSVDSIDDTVAKAESLGGEILMPATDVSTSGRIAAIRDPAGAVVMIWQAGAHIGAEMVNTSGAMCWNELKTTDIETSSNFYSQLFGWTIQEAGGVGSGYYEILNNGRPNAGMIEIRSEWGAMTPHWGVYFSVENLDETMQKVTANGGSLAYDMVDMPVGRFAEVVGPSKASGLKFIQLAAPAMEWQ